MIAVVCVLVLNVELPASGSFTGFMAVNDGLLWLPGIKRPPERADEPVGED